MKRCPSCGQTFDEEWLSFCTNDGVALIEEIGAAASSAPTMVVSNPPAVPDLNSPAYAAPAPMPQYSGGDNQPEWKPPPPPLYAQQQSNGLAVGSMVVGICSLVCLGILPGIVALVLGFAALSRIRKDPNLGGNSQAWTGIITGGLGVLIHGIVTIVYIILVVIGASSR